MFNFMPIWIMLQNAQKKNRQKTFCYCPNCKNELISSHSLENDTDFVYFKCSKCGQKSKWDFDAPTPLLIPEQN